MATSIQDSRAGRRAPAPEQRFVIRGVGWEGYEALLGLLGDRPVRVTYDRGDIELMSPSLDHESYKKRLGRMIETLTMELDIPCEGAGSTTWKKAIEDCGLEPDECYYLENSWRGAGRRNVNLSVDPPPDLAIEVELSASALDRMGIYASLGVAEVWRFDGEILTVEQLQENRTYDTVASSRQLPFVSLEAFVEWLHLADTMGQTRWIRLFRDWVRQELEPRFRELQAGE